MNQIFNRIKFGTILLTVEIVLGLAALPLAHAAPAQPLPEPLTFYTQLADPCSIRDFESLQAPKPNRVVTGFEKIRGNYMDDLQRDQVLKTWLVSTSTFSSVAKTDITLDLLQRGPSVLYRIRTREQEKSYILKLAPYKGPLEMWRVQNSLVAHPECWGNREGVEFFPRLVKLYEAAYWDSGDYGTVFLIVMDEAQGETLKASHNREDVMGWKADRVVGRSLGTMHYWMAANPEAPMKDWKTVTHGDLHNRNIAVDAQNQVTTLIDLDSIGFGHGISGDIYRLQAFYWTYEAGHYTPIAEHIGDLIQAEAKKQGKKIHEMYSDDVELEEIFSVDALIDLLQNPSDRLSLANSKPLQDFFRQFDHFRGFALGYIAALPNARQGEAREFFGDMCRDAFAAVAKRTLRGGGYSEGDEKHKQFLALFKQVLTPEFVACIDKNQINEFASLE